MTEARSRRVFFAVWPDDEAVSHLSALAHDLAARGGGRVMRPASLHLTLAFVGSVTPARLVRLEQIAAAVHADAFDLSLDRLGFWPQRGILWAGCRQSPPPPEAAGRVAGCRVDRRRLRHRSSLRFGPGTAHHAGAPHPLRVAAAAGNTDSLAGRQICPGRDPSAPFRRELQDTGQLPAS